MKKNLSFLNKAFHQPKLYIAAGILLLYILSVVVSHTDAMDLLVVRLVIQLILKNQVYIVVFIALLILLHVIERKIQKSDEKTKEDQHEIN